MTTPTLRSTRAVVFAAAILVAPALCHGAGAQILSWNNLGMHCIDSDYSVFSILPPYNTIEAQLIVAGRLLTNGAGYTVTYEAVADPIGSFNSTAIGKGNFYTYSSALYGATLAPDMGLAGWSMPGLANIPQTMLFEQTNHPAAGVSTPVNWWRAEGIPLAPYDDALRKNPYPMMRLVARDPGNNIIASNNIVLPVSDEMDCRACHGSGSYTNAMPQGGWVNDTNAERDFRLNILRLHDEKQFAQHESLYTNALAAGGFNPQGLYEGVVADGRPVLCAACHASEALGTSGYGTTPPLTSSVHARHASVPDPALGITLDSSLNRAACYRCHPGSTTRCLRGAMGAAVAADGSMAIQCQSCHGTMSQVGASNRVGWFMEPNCQSCHSGTALNNNGQIRYTSVFTDANGTVRQAADATFATQPDTPAPGLSLYRFSAGHGGLQCEACHGSTHAEFPSTHSSDNVRDIQLQGHAGVMIECTACHTTMPSTVTGGPHGMHAVGQDWVNRHPGLLEGGSASAAQCRACHGLDYRGTVLSRAQADRQLTANIENGGVAINLFRGAVVGCYLCHKGPNNDSANTSPAPTVSNVTAYTPSGQPVALTLPATGANLTLGIVSQPAHGSVGLSGTTATYYPENGFVGVDTFTFAAYDGSKNSNLGTAAVGVGTNAIPSLILTTNGVGSVSPDLTGQTLQIGHTYSITARPGVGYVFLNWTGSVTSAAPTLTFVMQSRMTLQANFVPNPFTSVKGAYHGLFYESDTVRQNRSGSFTLTVTASGKFSGKVQNGGSKFSVSGRFDGSGHAHAAVSRRNPTPLWLELQLDLTPDADRVSGTVSDGTWTAELAGDRAVYDGKSSIAPELGRYTVVIPASDSNPMEPFGTGYATVSVDKSGRVRLSGRLADGTAVSQRTVVSRNGHWPLYFSLYHSQGLLLSWMAFTNTPLSDLSGDVDWLKPVAPGSRYYPQGFSVVAAACGSAYTPPAVGERVLDVTNAVLVLDGGGLNQALTNLVTLNSNNRVTGSNSTSLSITRSTGVFRGTVKTPNTAKQTFVGVLLQKPNAGWGYFRGTNQSGRVYFGP